MKARSSGAVNSPLHANDSTRMPKLSAAQRHEPPRPRCGNAKATNKPARMTWASCTVIQSATRAAAAAAQRLLPSTKPRSSAYRKNTVTTISGAYMRAKRANSTCQDESR